MRPIKHGSDREGTVKLGLHIFTNKTKTRDDSGAHFTLSAIKTTELSALCQHAVVVKQILHSL
ncbi:hypothetical protein CXF82_06785 [Shewanella sp. GutDb-MelDb]|nr:hypothetical protein CXF82_06785 [Shewanella sp. GutDb-MelDb]